jgi:hypothetical protein
MINVVNNVYIDADDSSFMIVVWDGKKNEKGTLVNATRKYYTTFEAMADGLVKYFLREKIYSGTAKTLKDLVASVSEIREFVVKSCKAAPITKEDLSRV